MEKKSPKTAILIIGDEILSGSTKDTNSGWLATELGKLGLPVGEIRTVSDDMENIVEALNALRHRYKYVFTTGGIGPTHDDITADAVAAAFGVPLNIRADARKYLADAIGEENLNEARLRMARVPEESALVINPVNGAPGFEIENVFVLAGIPQIMMAMFEGIKNRLEHGKAVLARAIKADVREGAIADGFAALQAKYPDVSLGSYPSCDTERYTKLVARGTDAETLEAVMQEIATLITSLGETPVEVAA